MSRSNYDKPFYVDVGTCCAAIRCASTNERVIVFASSDRDLNMKEAERTCDMLNDECRIAMSKREHDGDGKDKDSNQDKELFERIIAVHYNLKQTMAKLQYDIGCLSSAIDILYGRVKS